MTTYSDAIKEIVKTEEELGIYHAKILGFSFWKIVRSFVIERHLQAKYKFERRDSLKKTSNPISLLNNFIKSFFEYIILIQKSTKTINNVFYAFPRLQFLGDIYIDKFTDPIISETNLANNTLIFQRPLSGVHKHPRTNKEQVIKSDFIEFSSKLLGIIFLPLTFLFFFPVILKTYKISKSFFSLRPIDIVKFTLKTSIFLLSYYFQKIILKKIKPKNIFIVSRELNYPVLLACKKLKIRTFELQHGVTNGHTILYSSIYDKEIDPDFFLTFGEFWEAKYFGVPEDKIINIGWAYKKRLDELQNSQIYDNKTVLIISEPTISKKLLKSIFELAKEYPEFNFHIRLHPQEMYNNSDLERINRIPNLSILNNNTEVNLVLASYQFIMGVNSSVLFEAISLNKKVGRIGFNGCSPHQTNNLFKEVFTPINKLTDFNTFIKRIEKEELKNPFYSKFEKERFIKLINILEAEPTRYDKD